MLPVDKKTELPKQWVSRCSGPPLPIITVTSNIYELRLPRGLPAKVFVATPRTIVPGGAARGHPAISFFGPVRNPWNLERSAGGSSGGAAAAVAAGIVPIAHGNDGGGSIRIPASCTGVVGLKPTRHRVPQGPDYGELLQGLSCEFALTRTVRDAAFVLDAVQGADRSTGRPE